MLKKEIQDTLKSTKSRLVMLVFFCILFYDFFKKILGNYYDFWTHPEVYDEDSLAAILPHPSMAGFLSGGDTGHLAQMIIVWLLPVWCLLLCGDSYIVERRNGYLPLLYSRSGRRDIFVSKVIAAFVSGFCVFGGALLFNFGMCCVAFGKGTSFYGVERFAHEESLWMGFSIDHPIATYLLYIVLFATICGSLCVVGVCLSFYLPVYPALYSVCFMLWFPQIPGRNSIAIAIQPFSLAKTGNILVAVSIFGVIVAIVIVLGYVRKVRYEAV